MSSNLKCIYFSQRKTKRSQFVKQIIIIIIVIIIIIIIIIININSLFFVNKFAEHK